MNVLLATYNFHPYNWGGSEVYVSGLAQFLQAQGKSVKLIAAVPDQAFEQYGVLWLGDCIRVCQYDYEGFVVYGVQHSLDITDIYQKYRIEWESDWRTFFAYLETQEHWIPNLLHLHGFTAIIGLALVKAVRQKFPTAPIYASYHTPISCPKGTLLRWEKEECSIRANPSDCSACTWQAKTNWPQWASQASVALLPKRQWPCLPTALRWNALIESTVVSFQELSRLVDFWWVFSEQIRTVLVKQGITQERISLGGHGVSPNYIQTTSLKRPISPMIFAFIGRFKTIKGLHTLLKAWQLLPVVSARQLWLIGDPQEAEANIQILLQSIQTRSDVQLLGKKNTAELTALYAQIHVLIIPSECVEIGPIVMHEAIARGTNVIASAIGGTKELAEHYQEACYLFPFGDATALSLQIAQFIYKSVDLKVETQEIHYTRISNWYTKNQ